MDLFLDFPEAERAALTQVATERGYVKLSDALTAASIGNNIETLGGNLMSVVVPVWEDTSYSIGNPEDYYSESGWMVYRYEGDEESVIVGEYLTTEELIAFLKDNMPAS